jgi:hypothetical protein
VVEGITGDLFGLPFPERRGDPQSRQHGLFSTPHRPQVSSIGA